MGHKRVDEARQSNDYCGPRISECTWRSCLVVERKIMSGAVEIPQLVRTRSPALAG